MVRLIQLVSACLMALLINGSDNATPSQLVSFAEHLKPESSRLLWYKSALLGNIDAANRLLVSAIDENDEYWLEQVAKIPTSQNQKIGIIKQHKTISKTAPATQNDTLKHVKSQAAYALAMQAANERKRLYWFAFASDLNHAQSQFELSLLLVDDDERLRLLKASATNHYVPAVITLAKFYHHNIAILPTASYSPAQLANAREQNQKLALYWLERASQYDGASAFDLALLHWQMGNKDAAKIAFEQSVLRGFEKSSDYLQVLLNYSEASIADLFLPIGDLEIDNLDMHNRTQWCAQQLQFVAGNLDTMVRAKQIKKQFEKDKRFNDLSICINPVVWLPKQSLFCATQSINTRINCDLSAFAKVLQHPAFTHLVVFAEMGRAYVQRGVMYLDSADEYSVFVHELAHFASFVDEYALSATMAHTHCSSASAPNLMVATDTGEFNDAKLQRWQNASETSLSIAPSRTCQRSGVKSFKPSADITFLEHHDTDNIPELYLYLWRQQLTRGQRIEAPNEFLHISTRADQAEEIAHWKSVLGAHMRFNKATEILKPPAYLTVPPL